MLVEFDVRIARKLREEIISPAVASNPGLDAMFGSKSAKSVETKHMTFLNILEINKKNILGCMLLEFVVRIARKLREEMISPAVASNPGLDAMFGSQSAKRVETKHRTFLNIIEINKTKQSWVVWSNLAFE